MDFGQKGSVTPQDMMIALPPDKKFCLQALNFGKCLQQFLAFLL
jgi:hypothetical protein